MLGNSRLMTTIPVRNLDRARAFYEGVLGFEFAGGPRADGSFESECGGGTGLFTNPTEENAGKSSATLAAWQVYDIEATANALRDKDVALEDYDMPGRDDEWPLTRRPRRSAQTRGSGSAMSCLTNSRRARRRRSARRLLEHELRRINAYTTTCSKFANAPPGWSSSKTSP
jgi:hypothetical protein